MRTRVLVGVVVVAAAAVLLWPTFRIELALSSVPVGEAELVEEITRGRRFCWAGTCPERLVVWRAPTPAHARCAEVERWIGTLEEPVRLLDIGTEGFARCGWIIDRDPVVLGVVVEEQSPGSDLIVTSRS